MLTLEACKALKDMGYPQDGGRSWDLITGYISAFLVGPPAERYASIPDSHDALEWLSKKLKENHLIRLMDSPELGPEWMKVADRYIIHAYPTDLWAYTPSDLILRVAERQCLPS